MHPYYYAPRGAHTELWHYVGTLLILLFWGAVIYGVAVLISRHLHSYHTDQSSPQTTAESPLDIAKKRYASGDITKEAYEQLVADLKA